MISVIALGAAACGSSSGDPSSDDGGKLPASIKIGSTLPLTGSGAPYGQSMLQGLELGLKDSESQLDGTKLELTSLDDQALAATAVTQTRQLINEKAVAIATAFTTPPLAQLPLAERAKVPLFNGGGNDPQLAGKDWLWNDNLMVDQTGLAMMQYAYDNLGVKNVAVLYDTNYTPAAGKAFGERWKQVSGTAPKVVSIDATTNDASAAINKLLADKPDALFIASSGNTLSLELKKLTQQGSTLPVIMPSGDAVSVPESKKAPFKIYYAGQTATAGSRLTAAYKAKYPGKEPDFLVVAMYQLGQIMGDAIVQVHASGRAITGENIQAVLSKKGATFKTDDDPAFAFSATQTATSKATIFEVKDGAAVVVAKDQATS